MPATNNVIDIVDKRVLTGFFNQGGYVLEFTTAQFDQFTEESIGVPLCSVYQLSKGKSLEEFTRRGDPAKVSKLYGDLVRFYEDEYPERLQDASVCKQLARIKGIVNKYSSHAFRIETPSIAKNGCEYIRSVVYRANEEVEKGEFDSALTKSRTLIEEVFCYVLEQRGERKNKGDDINTLYNRVKTMYSMRQRPDLDRRINELLSGLEKILSSLSAMRNIASDSHGVGSARIKIGKRHARLFVNSALTMAEFILAVAEEFNSKELSR